MRDKKRELRLLHDRLKKWLDKKDSLTAEEVELIEEALRHLEDDAEETEPDFDPWECDVLHRRVYPLARH